jgi:hypothetical protein
MSGNEVGSIEYMRSLVESDRAIARQCRDDLVAKCQSLAEMIDGDEGVEGIKTIEKSISRSQDLALMVEQRLYHLCQIAFDMHDLDFDMSALFPDSEAIAPLSAKFKDIVRQPSSEDERIIAERNAAYVALSSLRFIEQWGDRTFQQAASAPVNAYEDEDDPKFFDALMADKTLTWPDRTLHPSYSPKVLAEKLLDMDERLLRAIKAEKEKIRDSKVLFADDTGRSIGRLTFCSMLVESRSSAVATRLEWMGDGMNTEEGAIAQGAIAQ